LLKRLSEFDTRRVEEEEEEEEKKEKESRLIPDRTFHREFPGEIRAAAPFDALVSGIG